MSILGKLSVNYLKKYIKKSLISILAIAIVLTLLTSVVTILKSYQTYMLNAERKNGSWEVAFQNVDFSHLEEIKKGEGIKEIGIVELLGVASIENNSNFNIDIRAYDEKAIEQESIQLVKGRFPQNNNEIVVSENYINLQSYQPNSISLNINEKIQTYEIVGVIKVTNFERLEKGKYILSGITKFNEKLQEERKINISMINTKIEDIYKNVEKIASNNKIYNDKEETENNIKYNENLLGYAGVLKQETDFQKKLFFTASILIGIILLSAIIFIYSIFNIEITERTKYFASLKLAGTSSYQIIKTIFYEVTIILLFAIPLGLLFSFLLSTVLISMLNQILPSMQNNIDSIFYINQSEIMNINISTNLILFSIFIISIISYLSVILPAIKASKTSIIETMKDTKKKNIYKNNTLINILGIEFFLSFNNVKKYKFRYLTTILSLTLSIILIISANSYISNLYSYDKNINKEYNYSISIYDKDSNKTSKQISEEIIEELKEKQLATDVYSENGITLYTTLEDKTIHKELKTAMQQVPELQENLYPNTINEIQINCLVIDNATYENYLKELNISSLEKNECILINYSDVSTKYYEGIHFTNYREGDELSLYLYQKTYREELPDFNFFGNATTKTESLNEKDVKWKIKKVTDKYPFKLSSSEYITSNYCIITEETLMEMQKELLGASLSGPKSITIKVNTNQVTEIQKLEKIWKEQYHLSKEGIGSIELKLETSQIQKELIEIFLYSFIALILLVGICNIYNVLSSNLLLRKKEFVTLYSIGIEEKQVNKMLWIENTLYGAISFLLGSSIGLIFSYFMFSSMINTKIYNYIFPWNMILICFIGITILIILTTVYMKKKLKKENIINTIKENNGQ